MRRQHAVVVRVVGWTLLLCPIAAAESELWVHPSEAGSLQAAVDAAAKLESATIHLREGIHRVAQPLSLDRRHSRTRFVGHGGRAIVSGGVAVGGPPSDGGKNLSGWSVAAGMSAKCAGCKGEIWTAETPKGIESRQFYVNGVRANRTWVAFPPGSTKDPQGSVISVPGSDLQAFQFNQSAIELVYRGAGSAGSQWQESRCPVFNITKGQVRSYFLVFVPTIREIRAFYREM
eukprot:SAG31_NODE_351_length_17237_cov_7.010445_6_plen_232_part_00